MRKYDIVATVGTYQNKQGETKSRYKNVGVVIEKEAGKPFILIDRTFNLAGLPNPENRDQVLLSLFTPKDKGSDYNQGLQQKAVALDDEIDF